MRRLLTIPLLWLGGCQTTPAPVVPARFTQPMRLGGEQLTPGYHSDVPEITLTRLRAVIRLQVCAPGYVAVGTKGISLPC